MPTALAKGAHSRAQELYLEVSSQGFEDIKHDRVAKRSGFEACFLVCHGLLPYCSRHPSSMSNTRLHLLVERVEKKDGEQVTIDGDY